VTHLNGVQKYWYDASGNQTRRDVGADRYDLAWDRENRLTEVRKNSVLVATYVYDGDGNRVKATVSGATTAYVGSHYEWKGSVSTMVRFYHAGGQRVAMRTGSGPHLYLLTDHLGSTALMATSSGSKAREYRYKAYGDERYSSAGLVSTTYRYTGQPLEPSLNLYLMGARWYDPSLARWLSADTIVPDPANPQNLNLFAYVTGNPLRFIDPTGHKSRSQWEDEFRTAHGGQDPTDQDWWDYQFSLQFDEWIADFWDYTASLRALLWNADVTLQRGDIGWRLAQAKLVGEAVRAIGDRFGGDARRFIGGTTVVLQQEVKPWFTKVYDPKGDYQAFEYSGRMYMEPDARLRDHT